MALVHFMCEFDITFIKQVFKLRVGGQTQVSFIPASRHSFSIEFSGLTADLHPKENRIFLWYFSNMLLNPPCLLYIQRAWFLFCLTYKTGYPSASPLAFVELLQIFMGVSKKWFGACSFSLLYKEK